MRENINNNENKATPQSVEDRAKRYAREMANRDLNKVFNIFKYLPADDLSYTEKKLLYRIDLELAHREPHATMQVSSDTSGKYTMNFSNGVLNVERSCQDKERCFEKLKDFIKSLSSV